MKKLAMFMAVTGLILAATGAAQAAYVSTFTITQADFSLSGFSTGTGPLTSTPTTRPDYFDVTNMAGTYSLNIPPAGGSCDVYSSGSFWLDFDKNGTSDATGTWNEYLGNFISPGPGEHNENALKNHERSKYPSCPVIKTTFKEFRYCEQLRSVINRAEISKSVSQRREL